MTHQNIISAYASRILCISLLLWLAVIPADAQRKTAVAEPDTIPLWRGFQVGTDLVGPIQMAVGDYGQVEAMVRINLKDRYFPIVEIGYGHADHDDAVTLIHYKSNAPYARIGADFNILKNKHDIYRLYIGGRIGGSSFKFDITHPGLMDPVWNVRTPFNATGIKASAYWAELVAGVDVTIWGPVHMGWTGRYKAMIHNDYGPVGECWYVPGYGRRGSMRLGGTFNIMIEI